ncbi:MAG: Smr/MutS family protein [Deltaproteobacteria bacterium]|nr:Smr/MutS family protein [Deltaproteobacteria bacterium]
MDERTRKDPVPGGSGPAEEPPPHPVPVEESLDLHAFSPRDVVSVVEEYLEAAAGKRYREVRLIHGKGKGVQRSAIRALLARHPLVAAFTDAPPEAGGWGATRVVLKPGPE